MADEQTPEPQTPDTDQADTNPATEYQPGPSVVTVYDSEGREHFAAPTSKKIVDGLADGTFTTEPPTSTEDDANSQGTPSEPQTGSSAPGGDEQQSTEEGPDGVSDQTDEGPNPESGGAVGGSGSGDGAAETGGAGRGRRVGKA